MSPLIHAYVSFTIIGKQYRIVYNMWRLIINTKTNYSNLWYFVFKIYVDIHSIVLYIETTYDTIHIFN